MLSIEGLQVEVGGRLLLRDIDMSIEPGETHVMFGPNGSGKTTLLMAILGYPQVRIRSGRIVFDGRDITAWPIDERARLGIGVAHQRPPTIRGLRIRKLAELASGGRADVAALARRVEFESLLDREVNAGLSGGEIKRSELLQLMAQDPQLMLFDEPESGVDVENLHLVGAAIAEMLHRHPAGSPGVSIKRSRRERTKMGLIITHTGAILDYLSADKAQVLYGGSLSCQSHPREVLACIEQHGYKECAACSHDSN